MPLVLRLEHAERLERGVAVEIVGTVRISGEGASGEFADYRAEHRGPDGALLGEARVRLHRRSRGAWPLVARALGALFVDREG